MTHDIKALRLAQSMTQKRLAHEAGIDVRTLRRIEGGVAVSPESFRAVCLALKIPPVFVVDAPEPENSSSMSIAFMSLLEVTKRTVAALWRTAAGKEIVFVACVAAFASAAMGLHQWWARPNVGVTIAFDKACNELGVWTKAFSAMDRQFPNGYKVKDRSEGANDCVYTFEGYYDLAGPLDPKMTNLVRNLEHAGTKATVTYLSDPQDVAPRPKEYWESDNLINSKTVQNFARSSYERLHFPSSRDRKSDLAYAGRLFADRGSFEGFKRSLRISSAPNESSEGGEATSVVTSAASLVEKASDGVWTVKFRSKTSYSAGKSASQCADVTMRLKETDDELGILDVVSQLSTCRA